MPPYTIFCALLLIVFRMLGRKQLVSPSVFNKNSTIRGWNLNKSSIILKIQKHKQNVLNQTYFWKVLTFFPNFGSAWNLGTFGKSILWIFGNTKKPQTPSNTDYHPCTRPGWSRSLSEWSASIPIGLQRMPQTMSFRLATFAMSYSVQEFPDPEGLPERWFYSSIISSVNN